MKDKREKLNIFDEYKRQQLKVWQYPHVIFAVFSLLMVVTAYSIASAFVIEELPAMIFVVIAMILLLLFFGYFVVTIFNRVILAKRKESEFLSISAHQLRTPLSGVKWTLELLGKKMKIDKADKASMELVAAIDKATKELSQTVNMLLEMGRIETKSVKFHNEPVSLHEITKQELKSLNSFIAVQKIKLDFKSPPDSPLVSVDKLHVAIVIQNLMENAFRYSPTSSSVVIDISEQDQGMIAWSIADSGVGIPQDDQHDVFQKFFRAGNVQQEFPSGSGIGLYIAKAIIDLSGGQIGFESQEGEGSKFWFTLPIVIQQ